MRGAKPVETYKFLKIMEPYTYRKTMPVSILIEKMYGKGDNETLRIRLRELMFNVPRVTNSKITIVSLKELGKEMETQYFWMGKKNDLKDFLEKNSKFYLPQIKHRGFPETKSP